MFGARCSKEELDKEQVGHLCKRTHVQNFIQTAMRLVTVSGAECGLLGLVEKFVSMLQRCKSEVKVETLRELSKTSHEMFASWGGSAVVHPVTQDCFCIRLAELLSLCCFYLKP
jgi:hypothetical protein